MVKLRQQTRLAHERTQPRHESGLICGRPRQQRTIVGARGQGGGHELLDGHGPVQRMVERLVHHAKATHPQQGQNLKLTQAGTDRECIDMEHALRGCRAGTFSHGEKPQKSCTQKLRRRRFMKRRHHPPKKPSGHYKMHPEGEKIPLRVPFCRLCTGIKPAHPEVSSGTPRRRMVTIAACSVTATPSMQATTPMCSSTPC